MEGSKHGAEVLQGLWETWRTNDLLRLKGKLGYSDGVVTLYVSAWLQRA